MTSSGPESAPGPIDPRVVRTRHDILSAALKILVDEGADAVTHHRLAQAAGYSKATLYKHWRSRAQLLHDAFATFDKTPHHLPTGDVRVDLVAELTTFRRAIEEYRLDRTLAALVGLTASHPELEATRVKIVTDGEHVMRAVLGHVLAGPQLDAAVLMLCGSMINAALLHGRVPDDDVIAAGVDLVLAGTEFR